MSETEWKDEREKLSERLQKAEQIAAESQAEAAVYRDILEDWHEAAKRAIDEKDLSLLWKNNRLIPPDYLPNEEKVKWWGKLFLDAYRRDDRWLGHAKQVLERIKADAESLSVEDNEANMKLKQSIIGAAEEGLIVHF